MENNNTKPIFKDGFELVEGDRMNKSSSHVKTHDEKIGFLDETYEKIPEISDENERLRFLRERLQAFYKM